MAAHSAQALSAGNLQPGASRVLVHAGAGGVGHFTVQLAKVHWKAHVVATGSTKNIEFLKASSFPCRQSPCEKQLFSNSWSHRAGSRQPYYSTHQQRRSEIGERCHQPKCWTCSLQELGADEVVDYKTEDFAEKYKDQPFDLVVDTVGGGHCGVFT